MESEEPVRRATSDVLSTKITQGKDELNLAEFPLSAVAERLDPDQKTLVFEDRIWDESRGDMVTRQLTITASDQFGLPTAHDDEVILGLIQLSKMQEFAERKVSFTRYQLIRLLGWRDESKSYERIEKSLNRWIGVTLYYKNAWWDKENRSWVDEKFHLVDNVTLYDREKGKARTASGQVSLPLSSFTWNDVVFRSFRAGNLKSLDFDFYKTLKSSIAKRLYRFLDKRFFHRSSWEFNLKEVAWEHIGLSRSYDAANIKRKLLPGIGELEAAGFLKPMPDEERFRKVRSGEWRVVFEKAKAASAPVSIATTSRSQLVTALMERGVTASTAEKTVAGSPAEHVQSQLEVFDWLVAQGDPKVSKNPAGFLVTSIKSEYLPPKGFVSREEQAAKDAKAADRKKREEERARLAEAKVSEREASRRSAIDGFWSSLSEVERARMEEEALSLATPVQRDVLARGGTFADAVRLALFESYALGVLQQAA